MTVRNLGEVREGFQGEVILVQVGDDLEELGGVSVNCGLNYAAE